MFCKYRVALSVDGCGFRGIVPLKILAYLHDKIRNENPEIDVTSYVDLFTSTSASSIFTGALMLKDQDGKTIYSPNDLLNFYLSKGERMFSKNIGLDAANSNYPLSFVLDYFFGNVRLKDLKNHFLFYSYNQTQDRLVTFSKMNDRFYDLPLSTVMRACTVDDATFPSVLLSDSSLVDACSFIKNPALHSYNYMKLLYPDDYIVLVSFGFKCPKNNKQDVHEELLIRKEEDPLFYYFRYEPEVPEKINTDSHQQIINELLSVTEDYILKNNDQLDELLELILLKVS